MKKWYTKLWVKIIAVVCILAICAAGVIGVTLFTNQTNVDAGYDYSQNSLHKTLLGGRLKIYNTNYQTIPNQLLYNGSTNMTWGFAGPIKTLNNTDSGKNHGRWLSYTDLLIHYYELDGDIAYCFDATTADDQNVFQFFENLSDAGIPQTVRSHTEIMKLAVAAHMWTRNDFALMKSDNHWTWSNVKYNSSPVVMSMTDFRTYARSSDAFLRAMVQYMIWNYMNCTYYDAAGNLRNFNMHGGNNYVTGEHTFGGGYVIDKDGNSVYYPPSTLRSLVGFHNYVDFLGMIDYAYNLYKEETSFSAWQWQQEWSFKPGETKTITNANVIKYLDRIYATYGYIGSSSSKITYSKQSATSATLKAAADAPTHSWYAWQQDVNTENMIVSAPNYGSVTGTDNGGQFIVKVGDINRIRIRVKVENPLTHVYVQKDVPAGYNPAGAKFGVYASKADAEANRSRITTLTIGSNGKSNIYEYTMSGSSATLWLKELSPPTQSGDFDWVMDTSIKSVKLTSANTVTNPAKVTFKNTVTEYGYGYIAKTSDVPAAQKLVDGAEFTVYTSSGAVAKDYLTGKNVVLKIVNGQSETFALKTGTYTVKETKVPTGFAKCADTTVTITKGITTKISRTNHYKIAKAYVIKTSDRPDLINTYPLTNTKFGVYTDAACTTIAKDILTGKNCVLIVSADLTTNQVTLPLGTYYVKEIVVANGYKISAEVKTVKLTEDGKTYSVEFKNILSPGYGQVEKRY